VKYPAAFIGQAFNSSAFALMQVGIACHQNNHSLPYFSAYAVQWGGKSTTYRKQYSVITGCERENVHQ
jgi:hypothetical protein